MYRTPPQAPRRYLYTPDILMEDTTNIREKRQELLCSRKRKRRYSDYQDRELPRTWGSGTPAQERQGGKELVSAGGGSH